MQAEKERMVENGERKGCMGIVSLRSSHGLSLCQSLCHWLVETETCLTKSDCWRWTFTTYCHKLINDIMLTVYCKTSHKSQKVVLNNFSFLAPYCCDSHCHLPCVKKTSRSNFSNAAQTNLTFCWTCLSSRVHQDKHNFKKMFFIPCSCIYRRVHTNW